jgi:hypothetical protein
MKKSFLSFLSALLFLTIVPAAITGCKPASENQDANIHHTVFFCFNDSISSADQQVFFNELKKLSTIPVVIDFKIVVETGAKNSFTHGATMMFKNKEDYNSYNTNPMHVKFVQEVWKKNIKEFMEIDFQGTL